MTPEQQLYRDMWLAEMGAACRELPKGDRWEKRQTDRQQQHRLADRAVTVDRSSAA